MFSDQILHHITGQISHRFDSVPDGTLRAIVREALIARETIHMRTDSAIDQTPRKPATPHAKPAVAPKATVNRDRELERSRAYRDEAGAQLSDMWKGRGQK